MRPDIEAKLTTRQDSRNTRGTLSLRTVVASHNALRTVLAALGAYAALAHASQAAEPPSIATQKALTLDGARELIVAAQKVARARPTTGAVAVVDGGRQIDGARSPGRHLRRRVEHRERTLYVTARTGLTVCS